MPHLFFGNIALANLLRFNCISKLIKLKKNTKSIYWVEPERSCFPRRIIDGFVTFLKRIKKYNLKFLCVVKQNKKEDFFIHDRVKNPTKKIKTSWDFIEVISLYILIVDGYRLSDKFLIFLRNKSNLKTIYLQFGQKLDIQLFLESLNLIL